MDLDRRILVEDGKVARGKKSLHGLSGGVVSPLQDDARVRQVHVMVAVDGAVWSAEVISYFDKARFSDDVVTLR